MKKNIDKKKLNLSTQTVRVLTDDQLAHAAGGLKSPSTRPSSAQATC